MVSFFKKKAAEYSALNPVSFGLSTAAVGAIKITLFALALMSKSEFMMKLFARTHFVRSAEDVANFESHFQITPGTFFIGLIHHIVIFFLLGFVFAFIYNRVQQYMANNVA